MSSKRPEFVGATGPIKFKPPTIKIPKKMASILITIGVLVLGFIVIFNTCFTYIQPNEVGIKQVKIGLNKGMQQKVYGPGLTFVKPFMEVVHRLPQQLQVFDLTAGNSANIQTSDGFFVDVEATVLYRIVDPLLVVEKLGTGDSYVTNGISPKAVPYLKESLGELTTEDFYNSPLRVEKANKARERFNLEMQNMGIAVEHVLVRYFSYSTEIQRNIEEKKLQDQLVFKNQSEGRAATELAQVKKITQEGEANMLVTLQKGEAYKITKSAEKNLYVRKMTAEADLLVKLAEAKRTELINDSMRSVGADKAVALEMAEVLKGLEVVIIPTGGAGGMNPMDLGSMTELFGVEQKTGGSNNAN